MMNFDEMVALANENNTFMRKNRIRITEVDMDHAKAEAIITQELKNLHGNVHGGAYFTMADACCGILARADGRKYVTTDTSFRFLKGADAGTMVATSSVVKRGKTLSFFRVEIHLKETGEILADGDFTFFCTSEG
ncbi:MAG: PaaI family thioesterase [Firmicutes bacterium]|nr:PaaI family thioesterase [Bacillota bacterium]MBR5000771.1 PaaI family thioesterase [Bacillota bacterium]MBR6501633.1 PaaI family thioesterase [Bacillota bacterium]